MLAIVVGIVALSSPVARLIDAGLLLPLLALTGGLLAEGLSYGLSWNAGGSDPIRMECNLLLGG